MRRVVATAYAINPYKGSEDGTGWQYALQIARFNHLTIYTRKNNQLDIERYIEENPGLNAIENIDFKYYDTPYYQRFWKRGGSGALLYFYLWQYGVSKHIKKAGLEIDVVHNLNFHNNWTPTFLGRLKKPMVWGPVAFHPKVLKEYTINFNWKEKIKNSITWGLKRMIWALDPFLKRSVKLADVILAPNKESFDLLKVPSEKRVHLISVAAEVRQEIIKSTDVFSVLSVGRFVKLKGFDIVIKSFKLFRDSLPAEARDKVELTCIGKGPELSFIKDYISMHNLSSSVKIIQWLPRDELEEYYRRASCFLFCSHEGAGMVVPEAMSYGTPIICFDNIGPGVMVDEASGLKVAYSEYRNSISEFAHHLMNLYSNEELKIKLSKGAMARFEQELTWDKKGEIINQAYGKIA